MFRPDPTTLAGQALATIESQPGIRAMSVEANYGIDGNGDRFVLKTPPPRVTDQKRNKDHRCTSATYQYPDGSVLEFRWHPDRGARYHQGPPVPVASSENPQLAPPSRRRRGP
jgi:hypothetical protein